MEATISAEAWVPVSYLCGFYTQENWTLECTHKNYGHISTKP